MLNVDDKKGGKMSHCAFVGKIHHIKVLFIVNVVGIWSELLVFVGIANSRLTFPLFYVLSVFCICDKITSLSADTDMITGPLKIKKIRVKIPSFIFKFFLNCNSSFAMFLKRVRGRHKMCHNMAQKYL
jgi:hypothetical protein